MGYVKVYFDKSLQTNRPKYKHTFQSKDKCLGTTVSLKKGDAFGEFRMGSTIVLVFEAPTNFHFNLAPGQRIKMGEAIGCVPKSKHVDRVHKLCNNTVINVS